jgi:hypothetical protein
MNTITKKYQEGPGVRSTLFTMLVGKTEGTLFKVITFHLVIWRGRAVYEAIPKKISVSVSGNVGIEIALIRDFRGGQETHILLPYRSESRPLRLGRPKPRRSNVRNFDA